MTRTRAPKLTIDQIIVGYFMTAGLDEAQQLHRTAGTILTQRVAMTPPPAPVPAPAPGPGPRAVENRPAATPKRRGRKPKVAATEGALPAAPAVAQDTTGPVRRRRAVADMAPVVPPSTVVPELPPQDVDYEAEA